MDICSFIVDVFDNEFFVVFCNFIVVEINLFGIELDIVSVEEFDVGSFDNCLIDMMFFLFNIFICDEAGIIVMVMFIVVDVVGNIFICICLICIEVEVLMFIYSFGICGGDMLNFFVNLFVVEGGVVYIYVWCGLDGNIIFI